MRILNTELPGVYIIQPKLFEDERGWFMETYSYKIFQDLGISVVFVQDNHSYSKKRYTLRGIHFQNNPAAQSKLVRCTRGRILDVVVDLRKGSPTYKKWIAVELSEENKHMLFIPKGFGHAFLTLVDDVEVQYKVDEYYSKEHDRSIRWDDPDIGIDWPIRDPILSEKDRNAPFLKDSDCNYVYGSEDT